MTTWYCRPVSGEYGAEDGTSYEAAFDGFADINWAGVAAGDIIDLTGTFLEQLTIGASGTADAPILIQGGIIDGEDTRGNAIRAVSGRDNITFLGVEAVNSDPLSTGGNFNISGSAHRLIRCKTSGGRLGVGITGTDFLIDELIVTDNTILLDVINVAADGISGVIRNSDLWSIDANNADVIDISGTDLVLLHILGNRIRKGTGDKSAITMKAGSGTILIEDNIIDRGNSNGYGIRAETASFIGTVKIHRNYFSNFGATSGDLIQQDLGTVGNPSTFEIVSSILTGGRYAVICNTNNITNVYQTVFEGVGTRGIYDAASTSAMTLRCINSIFKDCTRNIHIAGTAVVDDIDYNCYANGDWFDGATKASFAAWQANGHDTNGINTDPKFISDTDYRLEGDSPCIAVGTKWWSGTPPTGKDQLRFFDKPSMGGYEVRPGKSGYARKLGALLLNTLSIGHDGVSARDL